MDNTLSSFKFIHCSDLHIDSPFKGVSNVNPDLADRLRESTLKSFHNIVDLAIQEKVDALIIAGDVFDGADKSLKAQFKFCSELSRLSEKEIPAFIAHGNHDSFDTWVTSLKWPKNVTVFSGEEVESFGVEKNGKEIARIYGISFPHRDVFENLALKFPNNDLDSFSIAVLHANVGGNKDHGKYAPCSVEDLNLQGMDYWALGHVHTRQILQQSNPTIIYPGNSQARNINETGAKGCCLITLHPTSPPTIKFIATDVIRYFTEKLDLSNCSTLNEAVKLISSFCEDLSGQAEGRDIIVRLTLVGCTSIHSELLASKNFEDFQEEIRGLLKNRNTLIGVELILNTKEIIDVDALRQGQGFVSDIINIFDQTENTESLLQDLRKDLAPLFENWGGHKELTEISDAELKELLQKAQDRTLGQLINPE
jgi:DNA repair exonuclease SbcCD nuclease subunit